MLVWMAAVVVVVVSAAGCVESGAVPCGFGTCAPTFACDELHGRCVLPAQLDSCSGLDDSADCAAGDAPGVCVDGVCLVKGCGDLRVNGAEQCDGDLFRDDADDCSDVGFYGSGAIACNADCTIDKTACAGLGYCGDGIEDDAHEACDFAAAETTATCASLGYYVGTAATCTAFCTYATEGTCSERCGDGMLNGAEICEPSLGITTDVSCLDYGYDSGALTCGPTCTPALAPCHTFGLHRIGTVPALAEDLWQAGPSDAFVVGRSGATTGVLWRWDGTSANPIATFGQFLNAVDGTSATNVIAVGDHGMIVRFDGATATQMTSPTTADLFAIDVIGPGLAVATGQGVVLTLSGSTWSTVTPPVVAALSGVTATSLTDIWVVGSGTHHYNGSAWTTPTTGGSSATNDIWRTGNEIYVVGNLGSFVHYDGSTWEVIDLGLSAANLTGVWGASANDILVVGTDDAMAHFNGTSWRVLAPSSGTAFKPFKVSGVAPANALVLSPSSQLLRWSGTAWAPPVAVPGANSASMWGTVGDLYVTAGTNLAHFDGASWTNVLSGSAISAVWGRNANDIYATEGGGVQHFGGASWAPMTLPPAIDNVVNLSGTATQLYGSTKTSDVVIYDGTWSVLTNLAGVGDIWAAGTNDLHAVTPGAIHHYNGASWTQTTFAGAGLTAIWGSAPNNIYVVGAAGKVLHYDGTTWTSLPVPTTVDLRAIHGTSASDVFIAGLDTLLHFDGATWSPVRVEASSVLGMWVMPEEIVLIDNATSAHTLVRACATCL